MSKGTVLITGAGGGLGSAFASQFLKSPYAADNHAIFTVRDPSRANHLQSIVTKKASPGQKSNIEILPLDLSKLENVRAFVSEIKKRVQAGTLPPIRALILNAAFQDANNETLKPQAFTADGFETTFAVNYLANFLLVLTILPSMDKDHGRIVGISSFSHDPDDKYNEVFYVPEKVMFTDTETLAKGVSYREGECKPYDAGIRRYAASKLLQLLFFGELQRRLSASPSLSHISVLTLDPGAMSTSLARRSPLFTRFLVHFLMPALQSIVVYFWPNGMIRSPAKSATDLLYACFDTNTLGEYPKGVYLNGTTTAKESSVESRDEAKQKKLWGESLKLAGIGEGDFMV